MMEGKPVSYSRMESRHRPHPAEANNRGTMHGGFIFYHLDTFCGLTAMRHSGRPVVTVSVDRMDFKRPVTLGLTVIYKTSVNMVHRSSMEVGARLEVEDAFTGETKHAGTAYLTFVAMEDGRPTPVRPLVAETDDDRRRMADAVRRAYLRRMERAQAKGRAFAFTIDLLPQSFFLCRFAPGITPPLLPGGSLAVSVVADNEVSLVFPDSAETASVVRDLSVAQGARMEKGWRAFAVRDALDLSLSGVVASLGAVLAAENISVQYVSSFSSGYMLVRGDAAEAAAEALRFAGHTVRSRV